MNPRSECENWILNPNDSDLGFIRIFFGLTYMGSDWLGTDFGMNQNQSDLIRLNPRLPIRINQKNVLNPNESEVRIIQIEFSIRTIPISDSLGFFSDWLRWVRMGLGQISKWIKINPI